jgi:D-alanyl-D-alanine dipeptidase
VKLVRSPAPGLRHAAVRASAAGAALFLLSTSVSKLAAQATPAQTAARDTTFRIVPVRPVEVLRREALRQTPPPQPDSLRAPDLVDLATLDSTIRFDIRYATTNNFMSSRMYASARAFLQRPAAEALLRAHRALAAHGYGLLIHDAYRPWYVTWMFWEATPPRLRSFVANPRSGSKHNRGCAVDLTLYDLATGLPVGMPSTYDEFSERAHPDYAGGTPDQTARRDLLRRTMEAEGFTVDAGEWWHYDYRDWARYPVLNVRFEEIAGRR